MINGKFKVYGAPGQLIEDPTQLLVVVGKGNLRPVVETLTHKPLFVVIVMVSITFIFRLDRKILGF